MVPVYSDCFGQSRNIQCSPVDHLRPAIRRLPWHSDHIGDQWHQATAVQYTTTCSWYTCWMNYTENKPTTAISSFSFCSTSSISVLTKNQARSPGQVTRPDHQARSPGQITRADLQMKLPEKVVQRWSNALQQHTESTKQICELNSNMTYYRITSLTVNRHRRHNYELYLAWTLSIIVTLAVIKLTLVRLTARHVTTTRHTAWEPVVAKRTCVTTPATIALNTGTLTTGQITLAGRWPHSTAFTRLQTETNNIIKIINIIINIISYYKMQTVHFIKVLTCVVCWCNGAASRGFHFHFLIMTLGKLFSHVPLSHDSIILYWLNGGDALWLGR